MVRQATKKNAWENKPPNMTDKAISKGSDMHLPVELQLKICREAVLMHKRQQKLQETQWWIEPIFDTWRKIAYYERQWPGSTEPMRPGSVSVPWEP